MNKFIWTITEIVITELLQKHAPLKRVNWKRPVCKRKPWVTNGLIQSIHKKHKLSKKNYQGTQMWTKTTTAGTIQTILTSLLRTRKDQYFRNYFDFYETNLRKVWNGVKAIINCKSVTDSVPKLMEINKISTSNINSIANAFNEYFGNITDTISKIRNAERTASSYLLTLLHNIIRNNYLNFITKWK